MENFCINNCQEYMHHHPIKTSQCNHTHHEHLHDHSHSHDHHHHAPNDKKLLKLSFFITFSVMFIEIFGGIYANSLALISDAIHMFTHSFALALSLFALVIATKPRDEIKTFGYFRAEVIVALINGLTVALSVLWIIYEAIVRLIHPEEILSQTTIIVAIIGLVVNVITGLLLLRADQQNINIRSAFLHMLADAVSSVAIIIGAIVIFYTDIFVIDTILALLVAFVIAKWSYSLLKDSVHILLEGSPKDTKAIEKDILDNFPKILQISDIHCWEISSNYYFLIAHLVVKDYENYDATISNISEYLQHKHNIGHITLQLQKQKSKWLVGVQSPLLKMRS